MKELLKRIDDLVEKPFVTARFGDNWKKHAKENMDIDSIIDIAWKQGRRSILLERALGEILQKKNISCSDCSKCELYENENSLPSNKYICKETEEFINDIDQYYCDAYETI